MERRSLGILAIVLIVLMGIVAVAGLDNLPRELRGSVEAAAQMVESDRSKLGDNRAAIERALAAEPALFAAQAAVWRQRLNAAQARLHSAESEIAALQKLAGENRREDGEKVEQGLQKLRSLRTGALEESEKIRRDAERWLDYKRNLPARLAAMQTAYDTVRAWDPAAALQPAQKAMTDWPAKRDDLQQRIDRLAEVRKAGEAAWESSAPARATAQSGGAADYAALFAADERLQNAAKELSAGANTINSLAQQLYADRNKVLTDLDDGNPKRQRVKVVETKYAGPDLKDGQVSEREQWEPIDNARYRQLSANVGMVVERKPAGKYDTEAERTAQAPAYAYVAPPGQANQYGSWSNGVWHWLPQYLILSQLLRGSQYGPITSGDYRDYDYARRRGNVWYGRDDQYRRSTGGGTWSRRGSAARRALESMARSAGQSRGWYQERPSGGGSSASRSGGFSGSRYQSRGGYSGSRYQSRGGGFGSRSYSRGFGRSFGRGGRR